jgi:integrase
MVINEKAIERLIAGKKRQQFMDSEVTGFGVRIETASSGGRKSFFYCVKVNNEKYFRSLGEVGVITLKDARDDAREWAGKIVAWKREGCPADKNPFGNPKRTTIPTFSELVESYIANCLLNPDPEIGALNKQRAEYNIRLLLKNRFAAWLDRPVTEINVDDVLAVRNACGKYHHMANTCVEFVRRIYNWSGDSGDGGKLNFWRVENPAKDVRLFPHGKKTARERFLQPHELVKFHEELKKEEHLDTRDVLALLLSTGARKSNVYEMRWADVSLQLKNWKIPMSKSGEGYDVPLSAAALEVLERRYRTKGESEFVFPAKSESGHIEDVKKRWSEFRKRAGFADVRLHDLRRTRGSYAAISGESLQKIGAMLGHKSLGSTEIYSKLNQESVREASLASDSMMKQVMAQAKKRSKREARAPKPKLLAVANG